MPALNCLTAPSFRGRPANRTIAALAALALLSSAARADLAYYRPGVLAGIAEDGSSVQMDVSPFDPGVEYRTLGGTLIAAASPYGLGVARGLRSLVFDPDAALLEYRGADGSLRPVTDDLGRHPDKTIINGDGGVLGVSQGRYYVADADGNATALPQPSSPVFGFDGYGDGGQFGFTSADFHAGVFEDGTWESLRDGDYAYSFADGGANPGAEARYVTGRVGVGDGRQSVADWAKVGAEWRFRAWDLDANAYTVSNPTDDGFAYAWSDSGPRYWLDLETGSMAEAPGDVPSGFRLLQRPVLTGPALGLTLFDGFTDSRIYLDADVPARPVPEPAPLAALGLGAAALARRRPSAFRGRRPGKRRVGGR